jgi:hypothetical protein
MQLLVVSASREKYHEAPQYSDMTAGWMTGIRFPAGAKIVLFFTADSGVCQIQWLWGFFPQGVKRPDREADYSPPK